MKKCILISRFNVSNIGDLAISNILYNITNEKYKVDRYNLFGDYKKIYDINNINHRKMSKFKMEVEIFINRYKLNSLLSIYSSIKKRFKRTRSELEYIIKEYDFVIIGGGNMIYETDTSLKTIKRFEKYINIADRVQKPILALDIGIGPFKTAEQIEYTVRLLSKCTYVTFRDEASYKLYIENGGDINKAFISIDPVFMLPNENKIHTGVNRTIGINIFNNKLIGKELRAYNTLIREYAKLADSLIEKKDVDIILFITEKLDQYALEDVYNHIQNKERVRIEEVNGLNQLIELYANIDLLIGTRMHSMIIAYTQLVPIIGLSWQTKVDELFKTISKKEYLFNIDNLEEDLIKIEDCCDSILDKIREEREYIADNLEIIRKRYNTSLEVLEHFK